MAQRMFYPPGPLWKFPGGVFLVSVAVTATFYSLELAGVSWPSVWNIPGVVVLISSLPWTDPWVSWLLGAHDLRAVWWFGYVHALVIGLGGALNALLLVLIWRVLRHGFARLRGSAT
jgi:hypothetical protein